ncbi:hypothetical protein [Pseudomonas tolaasii]
MSEAHCNNLPQRKALGMVTHDNTGGPFVVECQGCGEVYPSFHCLGGEQIADTGDHEDARCPHCDQVDPHECDNAALAWNTQQLKINGMQLLLSSVDQRRNELEALLEQVLENTNRALPSALLRSIRGKLPARAPCPAADESEREPFEAWHRGRFATKHSTGQPTRDMHSGILDEEYGPPAQQQMWEAWQARAALALPDGYCVMPTRLTAENGAKALLLGEFKLHVTNECPECCELEEPIEGCEICDGEGEYGQQHTISWDQIKFIYSTAVRGLAVKAKSAPVA